MTGACWVRPGGLDPASSSGTHKQRARLACESQGESGDSFAQKPRGLGFAQDTKKMGHPQGAGGMIAARTAHGTEAAVVRIEAGERKITG